MLDEQSAHSLYQLQSTILDMIILNAPLRIINQQLAIDSILTYVIWHGE